MMTSCSAAIWALSVNGRGRSDRSEGRSDVRRMMSARTRWNGVHLPCKADTGVFAPPARPRPDLGETYLRRRERNDKLRNDMHGIRQERCCGRAKALAKVGHASDPPHS